MTRFIRLNVAALSAALLFAAAGCGEDLPPSPPVEGADAGELPSGPDAAPVGPSDAATQPGEDAGTQPGEDAGTQPGEDAGTQPGEDAGTQPGEDAGPLPGEDAGTLPGEDAGTLPGEDAGTLPGDDAGTATTPPAAPTVTGTTPASPSNANSVAVTGTAEAGSTVTVYTAAGCSGTAAATATAAADGTFSASATVGDDTTTEFFATATNAGGTSPCSSTSATYAEDSTAPAVLLTGTTPASPSNSDLSPTIDGSTEAGASVTLFVDPLCVGTSFGGGVAAGDFSFEVSVPANSAYTFYAKSTDAAGNSSCSDGITYVHDDVAPAMVALTGTSPASPANDNEPELSGIADPQTTVTVYSDDTCQTALATATAAADGTFTVTVTAADDATTHYWAASTDAAGNTSPCSTTAFSYVEDSTPPAVPTLAAFVPTGPANNNDPTLTGAADPGSIVELFMTGDCSGAPAATGVAGNDGAFGVSVHVQDDVRSTFWARAVDPVGNASACTAASIAYVEDSTAPDAPVLTGTTPASPNNSSTTPLVAGTAELDATVRLYATTDCSGAALATGPAAGGAFSLQVTVAANATTNLRATATDSSGNTSPCSAALAYRHDTTAPAAPALTSMSASPANDNSPSVTGTAEAGSTIKLYLSASCSGAPNGTAQADATTGAFTVTGAVADDSTQPLYVSATDALGNASPCALAGTFIEDSTAPGVPTLTHSSPASPANDNLPELFGSAEAGSTVSLYLTADCSGAPAATGSAAAFQAQGLSVALLDNSTNAIRATATDTAGNRSACSQPLPFVEDSDLPGAPVISGTTPASPSLERQPTVNGTAEANAAIRLFTNATCTTAAPETGSASATGAFAIQVTVAPNVLTEYWARAVDAAGNASACSTTKATYRHDDVPPNRPSVAATNPLSPSSNNSPMVTGTAEAGAKVRIHDNATCSGTPLAEGSSLTGNYQVAVTVADNSTTTFWASAVDAAGNVSACSTTSVQYVEDSLAPATPSLVSTSPASPSPNNLVTVSGTGEAGSTVTLYGTAACSGAALGAPAVVSSTGIFSIQVTVPANSTTTFYAAATDAASNRSGCSSPALTYVEDSLSPAAPVLTGTDPVSPAYDQVVNVLGSGEAGARLTLYTNATCTQQLVPNATSLVGATGAFSVEVTTQSAGTFTWWARQIDAAGNASPCSATNVTYVRNFDGQPPTVALVEPLAGAILRGSNRFSATASDNRDLDRLEFTLLCGTSRLDLGTVEASPFEVVYDTSALADGPCMVRVTAFDAAGLSATDSASIVLDNTSPVFEVAQSRPANADLLSAPEATQQLNPARFRFTDANLDSAALAVAVTYKGQPLVEGADFTVTRLANGLDVRPNLGSPVFGNPSQAGDPLVFVVSKIRDLADSNLVAGQQPNVATDVRVAVVYDPVAPMANQVFPIGGRNARAIYQWNEPMDTASSSGLVFRSSFGTTNVPVEPTNGSGWLTLSQTNDTFYYVPADLLGNGTYTVNVASFRDLAGNASGGNTNNGFTILPGALTTARLLRYQFLARGTNTVLATVDAAQIYENGFLAAPTAVGQSWDVRAVFDRTIALNDGRLEPESAMGGDCSLRGRLDTSATIPNDSVRFDAVVPAGCSDLYVPWRGRDAFRVNISGNAPSMAGDFWFDVRSRMVVPGPAEKTAPAVVAVNGRRLNGSTPVLRPGEPLLIGFSEPVDPGTLTGPQFIITSPTTIRMQATLEDFIGSSTVLVRPIVGTLTPQRYRLTISGVRDLASDAGAMAQNTIATTDVEFEVAPLTPAKAPSLVASSPANGDDRLSSWMNLSLTFDDSISRATLTDTGAERGFRLEQHLGNGWVPLKGLGVEEEDARRTVAEVFVLGQVQDLNGSVFYSGYEYRLQVLGGATGVRNLDGTPLSSVPAAIVFRTAPDLAPSHRPTIGSFESEFMQSGGQWPDEARFRAWLNDMDPSPPDMWTLQVERLEAPPMSVISPASTSHDVELRLGAAEIGGMFVEGSVNKLLGTVTDFTANTSEQQSWVWAYRRANLTAARPSITGVDGVHTFTGAMGDPTDAARLARAMVVVLQMDPGFTEPVRVAYAGMAQLTRAADGSVTWKHAMAPDMALPLMPYQAYMAAILLEAPAIVGRGNSTMGISEMVGPFDQ